MTGDRSRPGGWLEWGRRHAWALLAAAFFAALLGPFVTRQDSEWDEVYVPAARRLLAGDDVYQQSGGYLYPPFMALAAVPFTDVPPWTNRLLFYLLNVAAAVVMVRSAWRAAGGGALPTWWSAPRREFTACCLGLGCGFVYVLDGFSHQQTDVLIGAAVLGGILAYARGRSWSAAGLFGLAAAAKCTALLFLPFLLWKRKPGPAALLLAVALGANLLPDLVATPSGGRPLLGQWFERYLRPMVLRPDAAPGFWGSDVIYNQSLAGLSQRYVLTTWQWGDDVDVKVVNGPLSPRALKRFLYLIEAGLLFGALFLCRRRTSDNVVNRPALEPALICCLMLLFSPMSSKPHFGTLLLPAFLLARAAVARRSVGLWICLGIALAAALVSNKDLWGGRLYTLYLWHGSVTIGTLTLFAGCAGLLWPRREADSLIIEEPVRRAA